MQQEELLIDGLAIQILRKAIKNSYLRIYPADGAIKLSVPQYVNAAFIEQIILPKLPWLQRQKALLATKQTRQAEAPFHFLGEPSPFKFPEERNKVKQLEEKLRIELRQQATALISKWEPILGVRVNYLGIKKMKTRWGSCNTKQQRIWLSLKLIEKNLACIEYVLVHEMIHLLEASHNKRFYALMTHFLPAWPRLEKELHQLPSAFS